MAPKATPTAIVSLLNAQVNAAQADTGIQRFADIGSSTFAGTAEAFSKFLVEDTERTGKIIRFAGLKPG